MCAKTISRISGIGPTISEFFSEFLKTGNRPQTVLHSVCCHSRSEPPKYVISTYKAILSVSLSVQES